MITPKPKGEKYEGRISRVLRDGIEAADRWTWFAGSGEQVVSRRTLERWRALVRKRLVGSAFAWLGPRLHLSWSDTESPASHLETLLERVTGAVLVTFRATLSHAVLDKPRRPVSRAHSTRRRVPGRLAPTPPQNVPPPPRPRGARWRSRGRGPPPAEPEEES